MRPLTAWQSVQVDPATGKRPVFVRGDVRGVPAGVVARRLSLPCGKCAACRLEYARQWAVRCVHENSLHSSSCFLTLTYDQTHLPVSGSLDVRHVQLFLKSLRNYLVRSSIDLRPTVGASMPGSAGIRYYLCGEYGDKMSRPHYHVLLFGFAFPDRVQFGRRESPSGPVVTYVSALLRELWPHGFSLIGDVTQESCAYVAGYVHKKVRGGERDRHYERIDESTGEVFRLVPEFTLMSRRPGIGAGWLEKFGREVFRSEGSSVVVDGREAGVPRFYVERLRNSDVLSHARHVRLQRRLAARLRRSPDAKARRLRDRLTVLEQKLKLFGRRSYEQSVE